MFKNKHFYYLDIADHEDIKKYHQQVMAQLEYAYHIHQIIYPHVAFYYWYFVIYRDDQFMDLSD